MTRPRRLPPLLRLLFVFLPGSDAECVRGDLEERYRRLAAHNPQLALRTVLSDAMRSVLWWWSPTAVRRRQVQSPNTLDAQEGERVSISMLVSDLRFTLRSLSRRPGFAAVVILTLGFGIGATATLYTIVDAVIVRPLPYDGADRLVALGITFPGREWADQKADLQALAGVSQLNFADWRERTRSFDAMAAAEPTAALMPTAEGGSELVPMARVTEGFFDLLRVRPLLGRTFRPDDHIGQSGALVVLSYGEWKTRYGGDPRVVGARLETLGTPYTILGVLPPEFRTPEVMGVDVALWIPLNGSDRRYRERGNRSLYVFGRLAEGATLANARAEVDNVQTALAQEFPEGNVYPNGDHFGAGANFLQDETVGASGRTLIIFFGAAALLLLIASLNAANLLLARGLDRQGEMSIRRALGAGRRRLTHGILLESVVLSLGGGLLGVALAFGGVQAFLAVAPADFPRLAEVAVNYRIIGIAALASVATGILVGAVPALRLTGTDLATAIRERGGPTATHPGGRLRDVLVGGQLALAVVLGVGASLL
ncbi:MAG: ABC transporter permease, partial [Gemmatimonadales bacterium]